MGKESGISRCKNL